MTLRPGFFLFTLLSLALPAFAGPKDDNKTVLCFVGHQTSHGFGAHEYAAGCHLIADWLKQKYPQAHIEARFAIPWPKAEEEETFFKDADSVVIFCSGGGGHVVNSHVPSFDKVMRTGAGLACLHYAVEVPIGPSAKGMLAWMGGYFETNWSVNPHWIAEFDTFPTGHPAARGVKPFKADDEWYFHMRFQGDMKGVTPILSAKAPASTMSRPDGPHSGNPAVRKAVADGLPQHVAWAYQRGEDYNNGRGFGFTGLHYHWNWQIDDFRKTVLNGVAWTAGLEIPANGIETETPTKEFLEENAVKWGGEQGRKKAGQPAPKANPNAKALFSSPVVENQKTKGHAVDISVELPKGSKELYLRVDDAGDFAFDWANWAEARLIMENGSEKNLSELNWKFAQSGWGQVHKNLNSAGGQMKVLGTAIQHGIGTHAPSLIAYDLPPGVKGFKARGVLDDGGTSQQGGQVPSSVRFEVFNLNPGMPAAGNASASSLNRTPEEAVGTLEIHPGLEVQLFASEPMIGSPSSIDIDAQGRVWVCDVVNYRRNQGKRQGGDKIMVLEDTDGDAKADKSTVFYQGNDVDSAHGICVLGDRVIISAGDDIFSLYDRDGDGKADPGSKKLMFTQIGGKQHDHGIHAMHFGPDGLLYFNFGNAGQKLCDPEGKLITDINDVECRSGNRPFQEGMVFRCDLEGKRVEMLGWNFRNNWEVCVDSFGTLWQSDNDDDGNKGVRINYVMPYGNYGYKDEMTGAGWRDPRPNIETEVPLMHWHLNDPGVVPNLLQTGAGSPTGICVYEGSLLPREFQGQIIHCDAGPNVVRAYPVKKYGAGYTAEIVNLVKARTDNWFRPSDVCVAPDGSLFVADWYDPGVGGHGMGDIERGRIFRVIPKGKAEKYAVKAADCSTTAGAIDALRSPNEAQRYLAAAKMDRNAEAAAPLRKILGDRGELPAMRARAFWQLLRQDGPSAAAAIGMAAESGNEDLAVAAVRGARFVNFGNQTSEIPQPEFAKFLRQILGFNDTPAVRREIAVNLRFFNDPAINQLWADLARRYDGKDRWYLEALGIGADRFWDDRLAALGSETHPDINWRSRGKNSAVRIADVLAKEQSADLKFLRAIDFQPQENRQAAYEKIFLEARPEIALSAAGKLSRAELAKLKGGAERLDALLAPVRGKAEFVDLAERLYLSGFEKEMADFIAAHPAAPESVNAARVILRNGNAARDLIAKAGDLNRASAIASALGRTNDRSVAGILRGPLLAADTPPAMKKVLIDAMATGSDSSRELIKIAREGKLQGELKDAAALSLARSPDRGVRNEAASVLPVPKALGADNLPPLDQLVAMKGSAGNGEALFEKATCATCHKIKGKGIDFGPDLSGIGAKLSREGLFQAILYPSAAISHGFHGLNIVTTDGTALVGFSTGETDTELQLRLPGGVQQNLPKKDIKVKIDLDQSLMPPGLAGIIGAQGLADLVTWLEGLK